MCIAECFVGDEAGVIVFTARNDQGMLIFSFMLRILLIYEIYGREMCWFSSSIF